MLGEAEDGKEKKKKKKVVRIKALELKEDRGVGRKKRRRNNRMGGEAGEGVEEKRKKVGGENFRYEGEVEKSGKKEINYRMGDKYF